MTARVERLAAQVVGLDEDEQQALWVCVAGLTYRRGLRRLSEQYRRRLQRQGKLSHSAEEILAKLRQDREAIAQHEYPG